MQSSGTHADLILKGAVVRTMHALNPVAEALAIRGNRILAIGSDEQVRQHAGPTTRTIDVGSALVLPGFNDAHVHFLTGGFSLSRADLRNATTPDDFARGLSAWAQNLPAGEWILGGQWDHEKWPGAALPTRELIDPFTSDRPVFVIRFDGHMGLANTLALRLAGISRETIDPPGGVIVRNPATGEPTGILKDAAQDLVTRVIPPRTTAQKATAAMAASDFAASLGVTSVTDVSGDDDVELYRQLAANGKLKTRVYAARPIPTWHVLAESANGISPADQLVRVGAVKGFSDGSLGSSTALFSEAYDDDRNNCGLLFDQMFPKGIMLDRAVGADRLGFQVLIHAIGDEANRVVLDIQSEILRRNGARDRRFRIEHAQHLHPEDIARFAAQGVIASVQPYHAVDDGCWCEKRIGRTRCQTAYPFKSLLDSGAILAFGTDWTVAPLDPLLTLQAAVTRQTLDGRHPNGWIPEQKITVEQAVRAYTVGSAFAEFADSHKGVLTPGKLADIVVLDRDIFSIPSDQITTARVRFTIMDGRVVYER